MQINSNPIELNQLLFEFSDYAGNLVNHAIKFPSNIKWVKYDGSISKKRDEHVYYWSIVNKSFHNLKACIEMQDFNWFYTDYYVFGDLILITIESCKPIESFELCDYKEMAQSYRLNDLVFIDLSISNGSVTGIYKPKNIYHPNACEVSFWGITNNYGESISVYEQLHDIKLLNICNTIDNINEGSKLVIVRDIAQAYFIIDQANTRLIKTQQNEISKAEKMTDIKWRIKGYSDLFENLELTDNTKLSNINALWQDFARQFKNI